MPAASKALALEYAANNIRFNTVSPGVVNTPMHAKDNHAALAKVLRGRGAGAPTEQRDYSATEPVY